MLWIWHMIWINGDSIIRQKNIESSGLKNSGNAVVDIICDGETIESDVRVNSSNQHCSFLMCDGLGAEGINEGRTEGIAIGRVRGKAEFVIELLSELGEVSTEISDAIMAEKDPARLLAYLKAASKADSVEKFRKETGL